MDKILAQFHMWLNANGVDSDKITLQIIANDRTAYAGVLWNVRQWLNTMLFNSKDCSVPVSNSFTYMGIKVEIKEREGR